MYTAVKYKGFCLIVTKDHFNETERDVRETTVEGRSSPTFYPNVKAEFGGTCCNPSYS
jgi:hypothetical protein